MIAKAFLVGLGGFLGALCRFGYIELCRNWDTDFPWATTLSNWTGSLLLASLLYIVFPNKWLSESYKLLLAVGFCGSLTTMSSFAFDFTEKLSANQIGSSLLFFVLNAVGCIAIFYVIKLAAE